MADVADPCAQIANSQFALIPDMLACVRSFPFNETLRQNVISVVSRYVLHNL
jgi:hypothetical protein